MQTHPITKRITEHGGSWAIGRKRSRRRFSTGTSVHVTLHSKIAFGERSLTNHWPLIEEIIQRNSRRFKVRIYQKAICNNHIHLLLRGRNRKKTQNFFRVVAGHIAQQILNRHPLTRAEERGGAHTRIRDGKLLCKKNQRKFWSVLLYSRIVKWGDDFATVFRYVIRNTLETLRVIPYKPRKNQNRGGAPTYRGREGPLVLV